MSGLTELPSTAATSLGPDKVDRIPYANETYRAQSFLINKIRVYLIQIGEMLGLGDGSTPGSLMARVNALEAQVSAPAPIKITGATQQLVNIIGSEVRLGGFGAFSPGAYSNPTISFEATFTFVPATAGSAEIRLYDMGTRAAPTAGTRRSTTTVPFTDVGVHKCVSRSLTVTPGPGVNTDTIADTERVYEVRAILIGANPGDALEVDNVAFSVIGTVAGGTFASTAPGYIVSAPAAELPNARVPAGANSVTVTDGGPGGSLSFALVNDAASPGPNMAYSTNGAGVKGWYAGGAGGAPAAFQWQPGGTPDPGHGVYTTWASLYAAVSAAPLEARTVRVDGTYAATILPAGAWDLSGWHFVGPQWITGNLVIDPGASFDLAAAAASPWAPIDNVFKLSFSDIYVDFGAGSPTATPFIDLSLYGGWNFDLRLVRAEVDSYSGAAFISSNAGGNVYVIMDGSAMVGAPGTDNVLRVDAGAQVVIYAYSATYVSNWISGNGIAQITRYGASTISAPVAPEFTGTYVLVENDYRPIFYSPGYAVPDNGYASWQDLYNYVSGLPLNARKRVYIDPTWAQAYVTPGTWDLSNWEFVGRSRDLTSLTIMNGATITVADGASLSFERMGLITNQAAGPAITVAPTTYTYLYFRECSVVTNTAQPLVQDTGGTNFLIVQATDTNFGTSLGGAVIDFGSTLLGGFITTRGTTEYQSADVLASGVGIANVTVRNEGLVTQWTPQVNLLGPTTYTDMFAQGQRYTITGATNENIPATIGTPEYTVGGFAYNPMTPTGRDWAPTFEAMALTAAVSAVVNFYDIGAPGALAAPTLVASITVLATQGRAQQLVSVNAGGPALNTIFNGERLYEIRVVSDAVNSILLYWAGIKIN